MLQISAEWFIGFADGTSRHTCNLASAVGVIYSPSKQLVSSGCTFLGLSTNNVDEYRKVIDLLWDATLHGITRLEFRLESWLMVSQLNGDYQVQNTNLLHQFLCVRLLEIKFEYISYNHISRNENTIINAYVNYIRVELNTHFVK